MANTKRPAPANEAPPRSAETPRRGTVDTPLALNTPVLSLPASDELFGAPDDTGDHPRAPRHDPYVGRVFAQRYTLEERIGRGGMGLVYRASQRGLDRPIVVKLLDLESRSREASHERFAREAQALSLLNHEHIVTIHDFGREAEHSYIVMELIEGVRLDMLLNVTAQLPLETFAPIAYQLLSAIAHAHDQQIVHRDLKPSNIMLTPKPGGTYHVKVLDFGLARLLAQPSELTHANALLGSIAYLAPEQIQGEPVDTRSDVYALGVLMYLMLTGMRPFDGPDTTILYHHIYTPPTPLAEHLSAPDALPEALCALILRCLSKTREVRPAHARELLDQLTQALSPELYLPRAPDEAPAQAKDALAEVALALDTLVTPVQVAPSVEPPQAQALSHAEDAPSGTPEGAAEADAAEVASAWRAAPDAPDDPPAADALEPSTPRPAQTTSRPSRLMLVALVVLIALIALLLAIAAS